MQVLRTEVTDAKDENGQQVLRVRFCGEGGNCITVDMAVDDGVEDLGAVDRAKAVLVRTASFDDAVNDYDARSNGNFDQVDVTSVDDLAGEATYVFEYRDGAASRQVPLSRMPSFDAAREEALRCAIDLLVDLEPGTDRLSGWLVRVRNAGGAVLCAIDVQEAEAAKQARQ